MSTPTLIRNFIAGGTVGQYRIVRFGAADGEVVQASAATDAILGVSCQPGSTPQGARCDVVLDGIAEVIAGGAITRGQLVTADATGAAVPAAPAAGVNNRVLGIAQVSAVAGDIIPVLLKQGQVQGA